MRIQTLVDLLQERAQHAGDQVAVRYLIDGERQQRAWTYGELERDARRVAAGLASTLRSGERVLLPFPHVPEVVPTILGCLFAGVVPVPCPFPQRSRWIDRLLGVAHDCRPRAIVAPEDALRSIRESVGGAGGDWLWHASESLLATDEASWRAPPTGERDLAYLQYTSGSTSMPRGVRVTHSCVLANLRATHRLLGHDEGIESIVMWMPLYHDMGLVGGLFQPLYSQATVTLLSPAHVVQQPLRWLRAIAETRAHTSGGPNFAYQLCVDRTTLAERESLDLSCWRVACNGAEPVRAATLRRFSEAFAVSGFRPETHYPCYGLAEHTLLATGGDYRAAPRVLRADTAALERQARLAPTDGPGRELVGCGRVAAGHELRIVDPDTCRELPAGGVGEIWLRGPSVADGYFRPSDDARQSFEAHVASDPAGRGYLRTGDLGAVWDGELYVVGRRKDLIILEGRNICPQDIEESVARSHPDLQPLGAAFSVDHDGEQLVVVHELTRRGVRGAHDEILDAVRGAIAAEHGVSVHSVLLVPPATIPVTSSGKVRRSECRRRLLEGELTVVARWRRDDGAAARAPARPSPQAAAELRTWIVEQVARRAQISVSRVDVRTPFDRLGLNSLDSMELAGELERRLGTRLPPTLLFDRPTIESLVTHLLGGDSERTPEVGGPRQEPIAVVGLACRFPGAAGKRDYWRLLIEGRDAVGELPPERLGPSGQRMLKCLNGNRRAAVSGGYLSTVESFDCEFFQMAPREAMYVDPQQRVLMEVAWEAFDDAGLDIRQVAGSRTGVFVGVSTNDYAQRFAHSADRLPPYWTTGNAASIAANRLSYFFDLRGPSLTVDTACSSSLAAVHLACQTLRSGECELAMAGGVNLILSPAISVSFALAGALSRDGRCKAFDARADGICRSEGVGAVVLKPWSAAIRDGDPVYAVILGSAMNQDGRTNGLTAPSQTAQESLLREAYRNAKVDPRDVQYIESHGAGTLLGDVIEANALAAVLGDRERPCVVGSVKTNLGHCEAASGMAGLIKTALAVHHGRIPPNLHWQEPNPHIPFDRLAFYIPNEATDWTDARRLAGISSFGFGGTNVHLVLGSPPLPATATPDGTPEEAPGPGPWLLPLSASSPAALGDLALSTAELLEKEEVAATGASPELAAARLAEFCHAMGQRRAGMDVRAALVCDAPAVASQALRELAAGGAPDSIVTGRVRGARPPVALIFTGHGAIFDRMGQELLSSEPVFRETLTRCDDVVRSIGEFSVLEPLRTGTAKSLPHSHAPLVVASVQLALVELWRSWGVHADAVVGHSVGEVVAAHVAGALSLEQTLQVLLVRSRLLDQLLRGGGDQGAMAAVRLPANELAEWLRPYGDQVAIAAHNSPWFTSLTGDAEVLRRLLKELRSHRIAGRMMEVPGAAHSPRVEAARVRLEAELAALGPSSCALPFYSTVVGDRCTEPLDAAYWGRNVRQPVLFQEAIESLRRDGHEVFLEVGPFPMLCNAMSQTLRPSAESQDTSLVVGSLSGDEDERRTLLASASRLYCHGVSVRLDQLSPPPRRRVTLPAYPWQRRRYWVDDQVVLEGGADHQTDHAAMGAAAPPSLTISWQAPSQPPTHATTGEAKWVVVGAGPLADAVAETLRPHGAVSRLADLSARDEVPALRELATAPQTDSSVDMPAGSRPRLEIVDLREAARPVTGTAEPWDIAAAAKTACALVRDLRDLSCDARLHVVTRCGQQTGPDDVSIELGAAALWGTWRTLGAEAPERTGAIVDLSAAGSPHREAALVVECLLDEAERECAVRAGRRLVPRLIPQPYEPGERVELRADATYVVTGGLGGLGRLVARWLVEQGARRLLLLGSTPLPDRSQWKRLDAETSVGRRVQTLRELETLGAEVLYRSCDLGRVEPVRQLFAEWGEECRPPIRGVVHLAGVVDGDPLDGPQDQFDRVFDAKARGAVALEESLGDQPLDFFVCFSSGASLLGSPLLSAYAAANGALDGLAQRRRGAGLPGMSINWGFWSEAGAALEMLRATGAESAPIGMLGIDNATGLRWLGELWGRPEAQWALLPFDWPLWAQHHPRAANAPLLRELVGESAGGAILTRSPGARDARVVDAAQLRADLRAMDVDRRRLALREELRSRLAQVLELEPERIGDQQPLDRLGIDSLMAVALRNNLESDLQVEIAVTQFLGGPTIERLAEQILPQLTGGELVSAAATPSASPVARVATALERLDTMTEEELDAELRRLEADNDQS